MAFKMKGMSFNNSPMKQDNGKKVKDTNTKKYRLAKGTRKNTSTGETVTDYFKIDSEGNKIKISQAEYNSMKGN